MKEFLEVVLFVILAFVITFAAIYGIEASFEKGQCKTLQSWSDLNYRWGFWTGCLVQTPEGYWVDPDKYLPIESIR